MLPAAPVPISANDPCRSVRQREQLSPDMRQRMINEGRSTDWKPYKRSIDGAFAIIQSRMTESMMRSLEEEAKYARAVIEGDLLAAIHQIKVKAIGGYRLLPMIVSRAISDVLDPRDNNHKQQENEPAEEYTTRFKKMVESAHSLRALNGSPLLEAHCILGLFKGLNRHFDAIKVNWQLESEEFTTLGEAIRKVNAAGQTMIDNESDRPGDEQTKRKLEVDAAAGYEKKKANDDRRLTVVPEVAGARFAKYKAFRRVPMPISAYPSSTAIQPGNVFHTEGFQSEADEDLYTAEQVSQIVDEALAENMVFTTQNAVHQPYMHYPHAVGGVSLQPSFAPHPYYAHNFPVYHTGQSAHYPGMAVHPQMISPRPQQICRLYAANGSCMYGNACKFLHLDPAGQVAPGTRSQVAPQPASASETAPGGAPLRSNTNPFAAKPGK